MGTGKETFPICYPKPLIQKKRKIGRGKIDTHVRLAKSDPIGQPNPL